MVAHLKDQLELVRLKQPKTFQNALENSASYLTVQVA